MTSEAVSYQNTNEDDEQHGADDDDGYQCNVVTSVVVLQEHTVPTHTHTHIPQRYCHSFCIDTSPQFLPVIHSPSV